MPAVALRGLANVERPCRRALLVELGEARAREVDLAADLDHLRGVVDRVRDGLDRLQVRGHVLADHPVAARRPADELAVLVEERDRDPVDLRLGDEAELAGRDVEPLQPIVQARLPGAELVRAPGVAEREHRLDVADLREAVGGAAADPLGRRVGGDRAAGRPPRAPAARASGRRTRRRRGSGRRARSSAGRPRRSAPQLGDAPLLRPGAHRRDTSPRSAPSSSMSQSASRSISPWSVSSKWTGVIDTRPSATALRSVPSSSSCEGSKP